MIVLDASVLIADLDDRDIHHGRAEQLRGEQTGAEPLRASAITIAETLVVPACAGRLREAPAGLSARLSAMGTDQLRGPRIS